MKVGVGVVYLHLGKVRLDYVQLSDYYYDDNQ